MPIHKLPSLMMQIHIFLLPQSGLSVGGLHLAESLLSAFPPLFLEEPRESRRKRMAAMHAVQDSTMRRTEVTATLCHTFGTVQVLVTSYHARAEKGLC